ncbi:hypothetical protein UFOVP133_5 [uncultured Caudovirales phage]|uniref:Uncharacterized protein n=1 Tax=uncultured Caudovirales phage TaxID=2100421 RepID=A0A6J5LG27_9CAUD|nr:hypothetical protein UFOVP133_5 [uncultured Caudovirales phage]
MNTKILKQARCLWNVDNVSRETNRANQRKWVRSLRMLGDKWLLAKPMERKHV